MAQKRVELEFTITGWRNRFQVAWSALRLSRVLMVMSEVAFYDAVIAANENRVFGDTPEENPE